MHQKIFMQWQKLFCCICYGCLTIPKHSQDNQQRATETGKITKNANN